MPRRIIFNIEKEFKYLSKVGPRPKEKENKRGKTLASDI